MQELKNIQDYDNYCVLNEDLLHGEQSACNRAFINGGMITFADGSSVDPREIVNVVQKGISHLMSEYRKTFSFATNTLNIIYLAHSRKIKTMAVDEHMNLYMNAGYIYHVLKMDYKLVAAVIMHEVLHALYDHIDRGKNWLAANGKSKTPSTWHDTNLAADVEVNQTLVRIGLISEERLIKEIRGMYLKNVGGDLGQNTNVVPMEIILNDEKYMARLREMCPPPPDPEEGQQGQKIKTSDEWNKGYKDAWNKVAGLIKKYGYKKVWEKLQEAGIINELGEIYTNKSIDDIKAVEFLTVKSYDEYVAEAAEKTYAVKPEDTGQTYEEGFNTAFGKLVAQLADAMSPGGDDDGEEGGGGNFGKQYDTELKDEDLDEIDIPQKNKKGKSGESDGLPQNLKSNNKGGEGDSNNQKSRSSGSGGQGKDDDELTDDDFNKLADDLNKKTNGGKDKISTEQEISIGGTGSFHDKVIDDDDLKEAGYSDEDIKTINDVRKDNEVNNSKERIRREIDKTRRELDKFNVIRKYLDAIEIESNKYRNLWKELLEEFMAKKTRRAGKDTPTGHNDWRRKSRIANGEYGIHHQSEAQDPQDVNIYVDVSGSVDMGLLEVIAKSLVVLTQEWEYSGLNICPWASRSNGVYKIEDFYDKDEKEITDEILTVISKGMSQCGGGTEVEAAIDAMIDVVEQTLNDDEKDEKDDVHIVITDGYFYYNNVENKIRQRIMSATGRSDVADKAPENTFWMIYDMDDSGKESWSKEIKKGKVIFITSEVVKNNG